MLSLDRNDPINFLIFTMDIFVKDELNKKLKHIYECEYAQFVRKHITNDSERGSRASYCRCNIDYQKKKIIKYSYTS